MKLVKEIIKAGNHPIGHLITHNALPTHRLNHLDPFLFLNHHGPQIFPPNNLGLPFGPHPHRGMETVTFIIEGEIMHRDSHGYKNIVEAGGIQWMTAGSGLVHEEISSPDFLKKGGNLEILQMWLNLPSNLKNSKPNYIGFQKDEIKKIKDNGVQIDLIAGTWKEQSANLETLTPINLALIYLKADQTISFESPETNNTFFYNIRGDVKVNDHRATMFDLVHFKQVGSKIKVNCLSNEAILLVGDALPFGEQIVAQGPFVMNSELEIRQAYEDYRAGKYGFF